MQTDTRAIGPATADPEAARTAYLDDLRRNGGTDRIRTVFLYDTPHYLMEEKPAELDRLIAEFVAGLGR